MKTESEMIEFYKTLDQRKELLFKLQGSMKPTEGILKAVWG